MSENNLKALRDKAGLSLAELGEMCGMSKAHIWELEKETANPTLKNAYKIARVFGVPVYEVWPDATQVVEEIIKVRRVVVREDIESNVVELGRAETGRVG